MIDVRGGRRYIDRMSAIAAVVSLLLTVLFVTGRDIAAIADIDDHIRIAISVICSAGIIMAAIWCRHRYRLCCAVGFAGYLAAMCITTALLGRYFYSGEWKVASNVFTAVVHGVYYYVIGLLYTQCVDRKYRYRSIALFCLLLLPVSFILIGLGTDLTVRPKLFMETVTNTTLMLGLLFYEVMLTAVLLGILSVPYMVNKHRHRHRKQETAITHERVT